MGGQGGLEGVAEGFDLAPVDLGRLGPLEQGHRRQPPGARLGGRTERDRQLLGIEGGVGRREVHRNGRSATTAGPAGVRIGRRLGATLDRVAIRLGRRFRLGPRRFRFTVIGTRRSLAR